MYKTIIFDLDGTLLNTLEDLTDAVNDSMRAFDYPEYDIDTIRRFVGNGIKKLIERAIPDGLDNPNFDACYDHFVNYYAIHNQDKTDLYEGIRETLSSLRQQGVNMAIVTNKLQAASDTLLENLFKPYINLIIGDNGKRANKPAPDGVNEALDILGVSDRSSVLYIGDSDVDAATAENSGLDYLLVTWGFRDKDQLIKWHPVSFIDKPEEILKFV